MTGLSFREHMPVVGRALLGEHNLKLSSKNELRYGTRGSLSIDLDKGTYFDHEAGNGGGVLDLIKREKGLHGQDAISFMREIGCDVPDRPREIVASYDYVDESGTLLFQVVRYQPKDFRQRRPDGRGSWDWSVQGVRQVPYRLPELLEALGQDQRVLIVEGEKDVDRLWKWRIPATCNAGGAGKWGDDLCQFFRGAEVVILPDNDPQSNNRNGSLRFHPDGRPVFPGKDHARDVAAKLAKVARSVRILELPDLPVKGDVSDWIDAGGTVERLNELVEIKAVPWEAHSPPLAPTNSASKAPWWRDPSTIPPRQFLLGQHYHRRTTGATIAAGGRCKTTLGCLEAVSMACGRDLLTGEPLASGPLRVWLLNGEEDQDELDRRLAAVCQHYKVSESDLGGRLFAESVRSQPLRIATIEKNIPTINREAVHQMIAFITDHRIDVLMVDPLVSFHSVIENDNGQMDFLVKQGFGGIANATNAAVELFHHTGKPKPGEAEATVEDGRGASAVLWAVRSARVLNFMTPTEAKNLGLSDGQRRLHIRIANGKANNAPTGNTKWMKIGTESLPNGDVVACGIGWTPPNPFQDVTVAQMRLARELAQTGTYRADSRSPQWFGYVLASLVGLDVTHDGTNSPQDLAKLKAIIKTWLNNKVLAREEREDEHRKKKAFIVPGPFKDESASDPCIDDE